MIVAVIPARGGSKRIPGKNIKLFRGKPIIAWSIEAALQSSCFDRVIVSTDSKEIAVVAEEFGAEAPFLRPTHLADDFTGTNAVIQHAIDWFIDRKEAIEQACCIYATAPFIRVSDIKKGKEYLDQGNSKFAFSATTFPFPIQRALKLSSSNRVSMFHPEHLMTRSQDLEEAWHDAGQFYWGTADGFMNNLPVFAEHSKAVPLPRSRVQDIDTLEDWQRAEYMHEALERMGEIC